MKRNDIYQYLNLYKNLFGDNIYLKSNSGFKDFIKVVGNPESSIVFIIEYKSKADLNNFKLNQLLNKMLSSINVSKEDVCVLNLLVPQGKTQLELSKYKIDIKNQLINMKSNLVVALGEVSLISVFNTKKIMNLRQKILNYNEMDLLVTYHPADLLENPDLKRYAWEDFKLIRDKYINV